MRSRQKFVIAGAIAGLLVAGAIAVTYWSGQSDAALMLRADDRETVKRGATIYAEYCASCHGKNLEGQPNWRQRLPSGRFPAPPHDENGHTWHHADELLFRLTKLGPAALVGGDYKSDMPAYADTLTDDEIIAALSYIKSTWPERLRDRHDMVNQRQRGQR